MSDSAKMIDSMELLGDAAGLRERMESDHLMQNYCARQPLDAAGMRERMESDGYLFFPRLVDADRTAAVKRDIMAILRERFIIEEDGAPDPIWSGGPQPTEAEYMAVYDRIVRLESFQELAQSPEVLAVLEAVCAGPVQVWEQQLIRLVYPDPEAEAAQGTGPHQDGDPKLGYKAGRFYTCWISLMEIDQTVGGLAVAPGSHRLGLLESAGTVASSSGQQGRQAGYGLDPSRLSWATADFLPGSAVLFHCRTAHRGLPNRSDRIRLSCDFRYQPAEDTASWLAHTPGPEVRRTAQQIDEVLSGRALWVTTRAEPELIGEIRRRMLEERSTTLERARELARELGGSP